MREDQFQADEDQNDSNTIPATAIGSKRVEVLLVGLAWKKNQGVYQNL